MSSGCCSSSHLPLIIIHFLQSQNTAYLTHISTTSFPESLICPLTTMHYTLPTMLAFQAPFTSAAGPYQPAEEYCDACSCGWAEDHDPELVPGPALLVLDSSLDLNLDHPQPRPDNGGVGVGVGCIRSPLCHVLHPGPTRPRPTSPQPIKRPVALLSPFLPVPGGTRCSRPVKRLGPLEDRDQPKPPPPKPLPPMLPPNPYPS